MALGKKHVYIDCFRLLQIRTLFLKAIIVLETAEATMASGSARQKWERRGLGRNQNMRRGYRWASTRATEPKRCAQ
jgi:hypothetical protein